MATAFTPHLPAADVALGTADLVILLTPLKGRDGQWRVLRQSIPAGATLQNSLPDAQEWGQVDINGRTIPPDEWATRQIQPGDEVWLTPAWNEPGSLTAILVATAISIALSLATAFLFAPKPPKGAGQDDPTYTISGIRSTRGPGQPVPVVYGRHRKGGQILSAYVSYPETYVDDGSAASTIPIQNFSGGGTTGGEDDSTAFPVTVQANNHGLVEFQDIRIRNVQGAPFLNNTWRVGTPTTHTFSLMGADGLDVSTASGGEIVIAGPLRQQATEKSARYNILWGIAEGRVEEIVERTIRLNDQPIQNFKNVNIDVRVGTEAQGVLTGFGSTRVTLADGREITTNGITYTTSQDVDEFILNIDFLEGLVHFLESGSQVSNSVILRYRFRENPNGDWSAYRLFQIVGERSSTVRFAVKRTNIAKDTYDVQVELVSAGHSDPTRSRWKPTLTSVTEVIEGTERYPHTALLAIRGIASESIQGDFPNMTVDVLGTRVRVGSFGDTPGWSNNPAWCLMDMMTNQRYGLKLPDSAIDLPAFQTFADYCEELDEDDKPRHTLNYVLDRYINDQDVIVEMLQGTRAEMIHSEGKWGPRPSRDDPPVQLLTAASCWNVRIDYVRDVDAINVLEVKYANADNRYQADVLTWPQEADWPAQVHKESIEVRGVTQPEQIQRYAQYELNRRSIPRRTLSMECGLEALRLVTHEIFRFAHPLPGWGTSGRVMDDPNNSTTVVMLDKELTFQTGLTYHLYVRHADDTTEVRPVVNPGAGTATQVTLSSPLTQTPVGRLSEWSFGESSPTDTAQVRFRVKEMRRTGDMTVLIEAVEHNPTIFADGPAVVLPPITDLPDPWGPAPPIVSLIATELARIDIGGGVRPIVTLSWDVIDLLEGFGLYGGAWVYRRVVQLSTMAGAVLAGEVEAAVTQPATDTADIADFQRVGDVGAGLLDFTHQNVVPGVTYQYRVVPINARGLPNFAGFDESVVHIAGGTTPNFRPGAPRRLRLINQAAETDLLVGGYDEDYSGEGYGPEPTPGTSTGATAWEGPDVIFTWDPPTPPVTGGALVTSYRIDLYAPGMAYRIRGPIFVTTPGYSYTHAANSEDHAQWHLPPARQILIRVWARTDAGLETIEPASLLVENPPPDMSGVTPVVTPVVEGLFISWEHWAAPRDSDHVAVYVGGSLVQTVGAQTQSVLALGLPGEQGTSVQVVPYDTFGAGVPSISVASTPLSPAAQWPFFARSVAPASLVFSADEATNTVSWNDSLITYMHSTGQTDQRVVTGSSAQWTGTTLFLSYPMGATALLVTTTLEATPGRALLAVYSGGNNLVPVIGKVTVHGGDILPQSISGASLNPASTLITTTTQLGTGVVHTNALGSRVVTGAHIGEFTIDTVNVASNAISAADVVTSTTSVAVPSNVETVVQELTNLLTDGGEVSLTYFGALSSGAANDLDAIVRLRKDSLTGSEIAKTRARFVNQTSPTRTPVSCGGVDFFPTSSQTYVVTILNVIAGDTAVLDDQQLTATNFKR